MFCPKGVFFIDAPMNSDLVTWQLVNFYFIHTMRVFGL